jgi:hypothetical protein
MNAFTGGKLGQRFEDAGTTNRAEIVVSDIQIFLDHPVFGAGVGASYELREQILEQKAVSHTEFTRLISEHGMFGVLAVILMVAMAISNTFRQPTIMGRAMVAGAAVWCCLFMLNAGMRMAAPSFMWGLMFTTMINPRRRPYTRRSNTLTRRHEALTQESPDGQDLTSTLNEK